MLPFGHFAVGYLCYSLAVRLWRERPPAGPAAIALVFGTQFPDLIDKPLAWSLGILPSGRSLGHSLLFGAALAIIVWWLARRYDAQEEATGFLFGHFSHIIADAAPAAMRGSWEELGLLFWPITSVYQYPGEMDRSIIGFLMNLSIDAIPTIELVLTGLALMLWLKDGCPGLNTIRELIRRG